MQHMRHAYVTLGLKRLIDKYSFICKCFEYGLKKKIMHVMQIMSEKEFIIAKPSDNLCMLFRKFKVF